MTKMTEQSEPKTFAKLGWYEGCETDGSERAVFEHAVLQDGWPTLKVSVDRPLSEANNYERVVDVWVLGKDELASFCAALCGLRKLFHAHERDDEGDSVFVFPNPLNVLQDSEFPDSSYLQTFLFSKEDADSYPFGHVPYEFFEIEQDEGHGLAKHSSSIITFNLAEKAELTAFALKRLSEVWQVSVMEAISILKLTYSEQWASEALY